MFLERDHILFLFFITWVWIWINGHTKRKETQDESGP